MPYVEGFGTWPFGEEWLWEALATVYLPLLEILPGRPVTLGLTPVLCDQLELLDGDAGARFLTFMRGVRADVHAEDERGLRRGGEQAAAAEVRRAGEDYARAAAAFERLGDDVIGAFRRLADDGGAELWAGPATHPVMPLIATDPGRRLQLASGLAGHERRFGAFGGGLWLPECGYEPGLEGELDDFGVRAFCVDQTEALGLGALEHLEPVATAAGPVAVPVDWATVALVWERGGYPAAPEHRDTHSRTLHDLMPWRNGGGPYDHEAAMARAAEQARDFVSRAIARLDRFRAERGRSGLLCCALDAELLGHWWYEGREWLRCVLEQAPRQGLRLDTVLGGLDRAEPVKRSLEPGSWGSPKDLSTWDAPAVASLAFEARGAELDVVAAARGLGAHPSLARAARELLALQSSDWAFLITRDLASNYARDRARAHRRSLDAALRALEDSPPAAPSPSLRNLAPALDLTPLLAS
jgi:1,4-alpha-glucan branching enzyme